MNCWVELNILILTWLGRGCGMVRKKADGEREGIQSLNFRRESFTFSSGQLVGYID